MVSLLGPCSLYKFVCKFEIFHSLLEFQSEYISTWTLLRDSSRSFRKFRYYLDLRKFHREGFGLCGGDFVDFHWRHDLFCSEAHDEK